MKAAITDSYKKFREFEGIKFYNEFEKNFPSEDLHFLCAKNDEVNFQIVFAEEDEFAYTVGTDPYFTVQGVILIYRVEVLTDGEDVAAKSYPVDFIDDDDGLKYSDVLLGTQSKYCKKYQPGIVFVRVKVPENAKAGMRTVRVNIYCRQMSDDETLFKTMEFAYRIYDYVMPRPQEQKFQLDLWQHVANVARYHEVELFSDKHFELLKSYVESLAELGQKAISIIASDAPWCSQSAYNHITGQSDLFEYGMAKVVKNRAGEFSFDFSPMKKYIDLCMSCGIDSEIDLFGLIGVWHDETVKLGSPIEGDSGAARIRYFDESDGCFKYMRRKCESEQYITALMDFFKREGWIDKVKIIADEPADWDVYLEQKRNFEKIYPDIKYKTAINHVEALKNIDHENTDIAPFIITMGSDGNWLEEYKKLNGRSKIYYYVCGGPKFPNTFILSNLLESRLIPVLASSMGVDGFLRWNYTVWTTDPRRQLHYMFHSGDLNFVYPSRGGEMLYSLRYFALKSGIKDFELLCRVKEETRAAVFDMLITDKKFFYDLVHKRAEECFSLEFSAYNEAKRLMLEELTKTR